VAATGLAHRFTGGLAGLASDRLLGESDLVPVHLAGLQSLLDTTANNFVVGTSAGCNVTTASFRSDGLAIVGALDGLGALGVAGEFRLLPDSAFAHVALGTVSEVGNFLEGVAGMYTVDHTVVDHADTSDGVAGRACCLDSTVLGKVGVASGVVDVFATGCFVLVYQVFAIDGLNDGGSLWDA